MRRHWRTIPGMPLLERENQLRALSEYAAEARGGEGRLVLVSGEAGVGKTTLLEAFEEVSAGARWAWGSCDGGFTPRPLGPLFDIAPQLGGDVATAVTARAGRDELFAALLETLADEPTVLILEDVQWADEATLDLIGFLARRLSRSPTLILVTYRDDALPADHPWRRVLGTVTTRRGARRIDVPRLTQAGVSSLAAASGVDAIELFELTGGNPYFVTELLSVPATGLTPSARDAVLARTSLLSHSARVSLQAAATIGGRVDLDLLSVVSQVSPEDLDELVEHGLLVSHPTGALRFRHELARLAVLGSVPPYRRIELHRRVLTALATQGCEDDARLAHHADEAQEMAAVLTHAPRAARRAAKLSAHREAALQYERALRWASSDARVRAELLDGLATELGLLDRWAESAAVRRDALDLWRGLEDRLREGDARRMLAQTLWRLGSGGEAREQLDLALTLVTPSGPTPELARATAQRAGQLMLSGDHRTAISVADDAVALGRGLALPDVVADALNTRGCSELGLGRAWTAAVTEALTVATEAGLGEQSGRAWVNLHSGLKDSLRYGEAEGLFHDAWNWCRDHDVPVYGNCLLGDRAELLERTGRWSEAAELARDLLGRADLSPVNRLHSYLVLGQIGVRRGDPDGLSLLDAGVRLAATVDEPQWSVPFGLVLTEAYWIDGEDALALESLEATTPHLGRVHPTVRGAHAVWARRLGHTIDSDGAPDPFSLELAGKSHEAARRWQALGADYQAALALLDGPDQDTWREALDLLDRLGATATARRVRARLRSNGVRGLDHGRRAETLAHPAGLTGREQQVLALLVERRTNAEIARALVISAKTVEHHVSAVLAKLGVDNRRDAAEAATVRHLAPEGSTTPT